VYDVQPDVVYCGYLPGYLGWYVWGPTVVWGTGWFYPGWCGAYYYPHPWTWGFAAHYSPWACSWSFGYPYGWGASPAWFAFYWGWGPHWVHDGWWCNGGFHGTHDGVHSALPRERLAKGSEQRGAQPPLGRDNLYNRRENVARRAKLASPAPAAPSARANIARRTPNDVFADRDGTVVRRAPTGAWQQRREGAWTTLEGVQPSPPVTTRPGAPERTRPALPERASPSERERPIPSLPERTRPSAPDVPRALPPSLRPESPMRSPDALERFNRARERGAQRLENFQRSRGLRPGTGARPGVRPGG
jgi:hypothetical protein